ncbi:MAG: hypothetical protein ONB48_13970 [candidate division KSB1 bacterium]|nr:hypothetical protein [candidate division KSB1 bacterium]MDZ7276465.1 hypothetical protein [candidate division KSB1 bacterium]MDZ7286754.1 hypothetical protein [candidate division KSB1 bacterium]MDZ7300235.1 hypothetical protein [candidate division KSB1 bacterium]MDZ7306741.1 hypothetical protein [candidate division KSB1 bacterium]
MSIKIKNHAGGPPNDSGSRYGRQIFRRSSGDFFCAAPTHDHHACRSPAIKTEIARSQVVKWGCQTTGARLSKLCPENQAAPTGKFLPCNEAGSAIDCNKWPGDNARGKQFEKSPDPDFKVAGKKGNDPRAGNTAQYFKKLARSQKNRFHRQERQDGIKILGNLGMFFVS